MIKLKFFKIHSTINVKNYVQLMNANQFSNKELIGFEVLSFNANTINAKFIEKITVNEIITDPFGMEKEISTTRYNIFDFELIYTKNNIYILKVYSAPKSLKNFFMLLSKVSNGGFFKETVKFDLESLFNQLISEKLFSRYIVSQIRVSSIPISEFSNAKIEITSNKNAYDEFKSINKYDNYQIEKIKLKIRYNNNMELLELSSTGLINLNHNLESIMENLIYSQIH